MYLKSLELTGFKSFAKKTVLNFTTPITAIVGPNGSGKSNIAEAFRFCLGEQSIKSMRGKRTEDLIWNGSSEFSRQSRAAVKLTFDNRLSHLPQAPSTSHSSSLTVRLPARQEEEGRERLLSVDFDEVSLERVIYRDSSSEYLLNGSQVRLRDIVELLAPAHIGSSGHHIISQGEADRILSASMKERREMIEDALGLKIFQWKREEAERKLLKTKENMREVQSLRKEIAPHLAFLKKQVEKLEKARQLKDDLRALYAEYLAREHAFIVVSKEQIAKKEHGPKAELTELSRTLLVAKKTIEGSQKHDEKTAAILALEERLRGLRTEQEQLSREVGRLEGEIAAVERIKNVHVRVHREEIRIPLVEVEKIITEAHRALSQEDAGFLRQALGKIQEILRSLAERYRQKIASPAGVGERDVVALREKKATVEGNLINLARDEAAAREEERKLRSQIEEENDSSREAEKEVFRIMARQNELASILNGLRQEEREIEHLEQDFKREQTEGALLVGREILEYAKTVTTGISATSEDRAEQKERGRKIERLKIRIEDAGVGGGAELLKEFEEASERDAFLARELADLEKSSETLRQLVVELEEKLEAEFRGGLEKINGEFQKFFTLMFGGGEARLTIEKTVPKIRSQFDEVLVADDIELQGIAAEERERESGIEIVVSLPRKKIKGLMMLSGGERALTSIALLFAMSQVKPPPFIILDETDAALDEANSKKYGDMIENLSAHSQLILITHNRETMSRAGVLYGVTMDRGGVSKLLSIAFDDAVVVAK